MLYKHWKDLKSHIFTNPWSSTEHNRGDFLIKAAAVTIELCPFKVPIYTISKYIGSILYKLILFS